MGTGARSGARALPTQSLLPQSFFDRETELVARELLGAVLRCRTPEGVASGRVVETEAYLGEDDPACHAVAGRTQRTHWLFGPPGVAYVYFIYGAHWCVNAVTREEGHGSAVLIRALEPLEGVELMRQRRRPPSGRPLRQDRDLTNGPGKLCAALGITGALDGTELFRRDSPLTLHAGEPVDGARVAVTPRIGITHAADRLLRWVVADSPHVSRAPSARR